MVDVAKAGRLVKVQYRAVLPEEEFSADARYRRLVFRMGCGDVVPGFEKAVAGMSVGETRKVVVPSGEAFGPHRDDRMLILKRNELPRDVNPKAGMPYKLRVGDRGAVTVRIAQVRQHSVLLDANHPFAGHDVKFEITLLEMTS